MSFLTILEELDWPPIFLVSGKQFAKADGSKMDRLTYGMASDKYPIITIAPGLRGKVRANTIYHEIGHHLFPNRPHWWIDLYGEVMARGGGRGHWARLYDKTIEDIPKRERLLRSSIRRSNELKKRYKLNSGS